MGILALIGVLLTGLLTYRNGLRTVAQKSEADTREAWWERAQWAMERCYDTEPKARAIGLVVLNRLRDSRLATPEDKVMMAEVAIAILTTP